MNRKYEVEAGSHIGLDSKEYKKGDVIVSDKDLLKIFPGKFKDLGETKEPLPKRTKPSSFLKATPSDAPAQEETKEPAKEEDTGGKVSPKRKIELE